MFMSSSLICIFIVCCLKSIYVFIVSYAFCLSVSGNIQVDSIKLLSTLATGGESKKEGVRGFGVCTRSC